MRLLYMYVQPVRGRTHDDNRRFTALAECQLILLAIDDMMITLCRVLSMQQETEEWIIIAARHCVPACNALTCMCVRERTLYFICYVLLPLPRCLGDQLELYVLLFLSVFFTLSISVVHTSSSLFSFIFYLFSLAFLFGYFLPFTSPTLFLCFLFFLFTYNYLFLSSLSLSSFLLLFFYNDFYTFPLSLISLLPYDLLCTYTCRYIHVCTYVRM